MRVNIYAEEMTDRLEIITKEIEGHKFTALRFYLELPCTIPVRSNNPLSTKGQKTRNVSGPFIHRPGDDDSAAVTFWGKQDLRIMLRKALAMLDEHYGERCNPMKSAVYFDTGNGDIYAGATKEQCVSAMLADSPETDLTKIREVDGSMQMRVEANEDGTGEELSTLDEEFTDLGYGYCIASENC